MPKDEKKLEQAAHPPVTAIPAASTDVPPSDEEFSLEEILAEYGRDLEAHLLQEVPEGDGEAPVPPDTPGETAPEPAPEPPQAPVVKEPAKAPEPSAPEKPVPTPQPEGFDPSPDELLHIPEAPEIPTVPVEEPGENAEKPEAAVPPAPEAAPPPPPPADPERIPGVSKSISIEDVVNFTVDAVMEEQASEAFLPPKKRKLFQRRPLEDSERIPPPPEPELEPDPEPIGPEPDLWDAAMEHRRDWLRRRRTRFPALLAALVPTLVLLIERQGLFVPFWSGDPHFQTLFLLAFLALTALLSRHVFVKGFTLLLRGRCVSELLIALSAFAAAADCLLRLRLEARTDAMPYAAVSCLALAAAQWGVCWESQGMYDMYRAASVDAAPPYLIAGTDRGACKQRGSVRGFYTTAARSDIATLFQTALLPVFTVATVVFAGLSSMGQERSADFFLNWSAILAAAGTFSLPLCWSFPWALLSRHLQKTGCAVASWSGAQKISARRCMIVTDTDLFPPGTVFLKGRKTYGETSDVAVSYAASMARAAGCGLTRLFDGLIRSEGGRYEDVDDFSFYEEGGYAGTIRGESVLMGTANFLKKMDIRLPGEINLKTGVFLAVDRRLIAVFAVKYNPSENVDFALKMMRRSRILPVLASRDPNITPALIRRKFSKNIRLEYPDLTERVALSEAENDHDLPRALLFREGLLPYAEAVAGSLRLCKAVRRAIILSLLGSWAGVLLTFYLVSLGQYGLLTPLALETFLLLWTLPVLLMADWTKRY
ncbi:MAG: hypothetical protein HFF90_09775 [Oscillibacter sp.]|nr:hypothetical protein [Oscillibacter sp.]